MLFESNFVLDTQGVKKVYLASEPNIVEFYSESNLNTEPEVLTQFVIDIEVGQTHLPARGDVWVFTVDRYLDNIEAKDYEIIVSPIDNAGYLDSNYFNLTFVGGI